jgi:hypothetical protein
VVFLICKQFFACNGEDGGEIDKIKELEIL